MATVTLFKNRSGAVNVSTPKGKVLKFAASRYFTNNVEDSDFLKELAQTNQSGVFIDKNEPTVDTENLDPMSAIKAKMRAEIEAEIKSGKVNKATPSNTGNYDQAVLQNSTQNTMGTATPGAGDPQNPAELKEPATATVAPATASTVKVSGDAGETGEPVAVPSKLEGMKKGPSKS